MEQQEISPKKQKALDKVKRANAELAKIVREEKEQLRKTQDRHKYMMGGCVTMLNNAIRYARAGYEVAKKTYDELLAKPMVAIKKAKNEITE